MQKINEHLTSTAPPPTNPGPTFSDEQLTKVNLFFARMHTIYGELKYRKSWPTVEAENLAKREWAPQILAKTDVELSNLLAFAKGMMYDRQWQWPDIGRILAGSHDDRSARSGQDALAHRSIDQVRLPTSPWADPWLPPDKPAERTDTERQTGRAALTDLLGGL